MEHYQITKVTTEQEDEAMQMIREYFQKGLNAIVDATTLARSVADLTAKVEELGKDVQKLRDRNAWLDEQVVSLREARDAAHRELSTVKLDLATVNGECNRLQHHNDNQRGELARLGAEVYEANKARDDAEIRVLEMEEENKRLRDIVEAVRSALPTGAATVPAPTPGWPPATEEPKQASSW